MKQLLFTFALILGAGFAVIAQEKTVVKDEKIVKPTSTAKQRVHNTFSKNKEHNGKKVIHKKTVETSAK